VGRRRVTAYTVAAMRTAATAMKIALSIVWMSQKCDGGAVIYPAGSYRVHSRSAHRSP